MKNRWLDGLLERPRCLVALLAALSVAWAPVPKAKSKADLVKEELKRLQGSWAQARRYHDGAKAYRVKEEALDVISGDRLTCFVDGEVASQWQVVLHPSRDPKAMDLKGGGGELLPCAYKLEGDELTVAYRMKGNGKGRPADLTPREGMWVVVYKRLKKKP